MIQLTQNDGFSVDDDPTTEQIRQAAETINRLPRGYLPFELFVAIASKITTPTMELAPLRRREDGGVDILLTQRPVDDPYWPSSWHIPGTVLLATDRENSFESGIERILTNELHGSITPISSVEQVGIKFWDVARGRELDMLHYFETRAKDEDVVEGRFFDVANLPENTLDHHKIIISEIIDTFTATKL